MKYMIKLLTLFALVFSLNAYEITEDEFPFILPISVEFESFGLQRKSVKTNVLGSDVSGTETRASNEMTSFAKTDILKSEILDEDGDGIADYEDKCLGTRPGRDVNAQGCTLIADKDRDGIADRYDKCPKTGKNFIVNIHGCPQTTTLKINFETAKYNIANRYISNVESFAKFLKENKKYEVIIYGHTDSVGNAEYNLNLSQNRASSVKKTLINYGINATRMIPVGRGENHPIGNNGTEDGKAQNRRVEIELI